MTENNLGLIYASRIRGERAENLERAVAHSEAALTVYTREAFPREWAGIHINLGMAYSNRIRGERALNLERAIAHYEAALTVYTREAFPKQWAMTQNSLAATYQNRICGERVDILSRTRDVPPQKAYFLQKTNASVVYPRLLSKGRSANFLFYIYPRSMKNTARPVIEQLKKTDDMAEQANDLRWRVGEHIVVSLHCAVLKIMPQEHRLMIKNRLNKIAFSVIPLDTAAVGGHDALINIFNHDTKDTLESILFKITIADFVFDHVSRPLLSKISAAVLGCVSAGSFVLTSLKEIDSTLGMAAGTAAATFIAVILGWGYIPFHRTKVVDREIAI